MYLTALSVAATKSFIISFFNEVLRHREKKINKTGHKVYLSSSEARVRHGEVLRHASLRMDQTRPQTQILDSPSIFKTITGQVGLPRCNASHARAIGPRSTPHPIEWPQRIRTSPAKASYGRIGLS